MRRSRLIRLGLRLLKIPTEKGRQPFGKRPARRRDSPVLKATAARSGTSVARRRQPRRFPERARTEVVATQSGVCLMTTLQPVLVR